MAKTPLLQTSQTTAAELLLGVEWRLDEAFQAFSILRQLNERCDANTCPQLSAIVDQTSSFWQAASLGLQTTLILCIAAVLDRRPDCAAFYSAIAALTPPQKQRLSPALEKSLDVVRDRYIKYRHKLFAHNDKRRCDLMLDMQSAGFSWDSVSQDLQQLNRTLKFLRDVATDMQLPDWRQLDTPIRMRDLSAMRAREHTDMLLDLLLAGKSSVLRCR